MNRSRSGDSLDAGFDGIKRSSSDSSLSTEFTSDDETGTDNLPFIPGQLLNAGSQQANKQLYGNYASLLGENINTNKPPFSRLSTNLKSLSEQEIDARHRSALVGSSKYAEHTQQISDLSNMADASSSLLSGVKQNLNPYIDLQSVKSLMVDDKRLQQALIDNFDDPDLVVDDSENIDVLSDEERVNLLLQRASSPTTSYPRLDQRMDNGTMRVCSRLIDDGIPNLRANWRMNSGATRMCSRLLECRNLIEAIEFVDQNRDTIDSLTRIITHEAPAFRNYDICNYQIDNSVKESFNPDFWSDREPVVTTADGNCQYHAVSISLTGSETYTPEVRLATAVAVIDNREWFDSVLKLIDRGSVLDLVYTIARSHSWGDETTLKAIAVAINRRIFLYTCNIGKKDYELVKSLSKEELQDAFKEKKYRGGTGIHAYADPLNRVNANNYIMLFHKSEHFIAVLPTCQQLTMFEPYNPIVPVFN